MALYVIVRVWDSMESFQNQAEPIRDYHMDHDDANQRKVLGEQCFNAFRAGQVVLTYKSSTQPRAEHTEHKNNKNNNNNKNNKTFRPRSKQFVARGNHQLADKLSELSSLTDTDLELLAALDAACVPVKESMESFEDDNHGNR